MVPGVRFGTITFAGLTVVLLGSGCQSSAVNAKGKGASNAELALWVMLALLVPVFIVVVGLVVGAFVWRPSWLRGFVSSRGLIYVAGIALPVTLAITFFGLTLAAGRTYAASEGSAPDVIVHGHLWWWEVEYPHEGITIANELRIPVGRDVTVELHSDNVIHSLWVPALQGKMDLIPGVTNKVVLRADRPGVYRGQCAEFCGLEHAKMAFLVVAYRPLAYSQWIAARQSSAEQADNGPLPAGLGVFIGAGCRWCHSIDGTIADGRVGPDLTHVADRLTLGAGSVANNRANLARWIAEPGSIKPGVLMPAFEGTLAPAEMGALIDYLETLR